MVLRFRDYLFSVLSEPAVGTFFSKVNKNKSKFVIFEIQIQIHKKKVFKNGKKDCGEPKIP